MKKILVGCYEIPGDGGASTATYSLFQMMQADGLDVICLNIINEQDVGYYRYVFGENYGNPNCLPNVYNCHLQASLFAPHPELETLIRHLSPDVIIGVDFIAALLMKRAAPDIRLAFLTGGCAQAMEYIAQRKFKSGEALIEFLRQVKGVPPLLHQREQEAIAISDLIIMHSYLTKELYGYFFPFYGGKVHADIIWFAEWIYNSALEYSNLRQPFADREIDVLFIASIWERPVKNYKFVQQIVEGLSGVKIDIVGETDNELTGATHHGFVTNREQLFALLGNTKTVVSPSVLDAAPGILFEASAMGCNIIASKNCGNWQICHDDLLVHHFTAADFLEKIPLSLSKKHDDKIDYFRQANAYQELIDTVLVLADI